MPDSHASSSPVPPTPQTTIGIVVGSTRPGRRGPAVARWVQDHARAKCPAARFDLIDVAEFDLPLLNEPQPAAYGEYHHPHSLAWARTVERYDGFVFVTPEYNHSTSAALKNALDYLYVEWQNKAAGFVGYGIVGGSRAVEHLRQIVAELHIAGVRTAVGLSLMSDFVDDQLRPAPYQLSVLHDMLDELLTWSGALATIRHP